MITSATSPDHITIKWIEKATTKPNYEEKYLSSYLKKDDQHFETTSTAKNTDAITKCYIQQYIQRSIIYKSQELRKFSHYCIFRVHTNTSASTCANIIFS